MIGNSQNFFRCLRKPQRSVKNSTVHTSVRFFNVPSRESVIAHEHRGFSTRLEGAQVQRVSAHDAPYECNWSND